MAQAKSECAARIRVSGVVQGVGFRPFVYNLACRLDLLGWVNNDSEGVHCVVEGSRDAVERFVAELTDSAPPRAVVESVDVESISPNSFQRFEIRESNRVEGEWTLVSPDIATCPACLAELRDPADRRNRYPFTNCTNCGPRFTIIRDVPYDRPATTMRDFPLCPSCSAEYADPADRRFHAQPNACPVCGPRLYLGVPGRETGFEWTAEAERAPRPLRELHPERARTEAILAETVTLLRSGAVVALKGLGGFHLACDAADEEAVSRLRDRKHRWDKPFAVMFPSLEAVAGHCEVSAQEAELLEGAVRPIVLLDALGASAGKQLAPSVAPGLHELGVMLPYTPLHHLLLGDLGRPLVMTSGNMSDEPIVMDNAEALDRLAPLADAFLLHDRGIHARYDDSVVRVAAGAPRMLRRARGYAPFPVRMPLASPVPILAAGPEQKNTFCLARGYHAFVSQHIGDMENADALEHYEEALEQFELMFRIQPEVVAHDLHPEYLSTKFALGLGLPASGVQHHHAHVAAVSGEHGVDAPVVGLAFDGTGYGTDGTLWGGEVLIASWDSFERFAHLRPVPMPGGAAAIRRPARMALGLLLRTDRGLLSRPGLKHLLSRLAPHELAIVDAIIGRGINSPLTSSLGRLFDAVAAISGVRDDAGYEGQAAIELEALADPYERSAYRFGLTEGSPLVIEPLPLLERLLADVAARVPVQTISARFHNAVIDVSVDLARRAAEAAGARHVVLSGGVFANRILAEGIADGVAAAGLTPLLPRELPPGDGAISFGQAVVAVSRLDGVSGK